MKKTMYLFILILITFAFLLASCSIPQSGSTAKENYSTKTITVENGEPITVGNGGAAVKMSIQGLSFSLTSGIATSKINADLTLSWSGTLTITGDGITGTYTTQISRNNLDNGGYLTLNLPLGQKTFNLTINYNNGAATYSGTATANIQTGSNAISITLASTGTGSGTITAGLTENITISARDDITGVAVANAQIQFTQGSTVVKTVTTGSDGQTSVDLPVQGTTDVPYNYTITQNKYVPTTGTIKVLIGNEIIVDGLDTTVMHLSGNMIKDPKMTSSQSYILFDEIQIIWEYVPVTVVTNSYSTIVSVTAVNADLMYIDTATSTYWFQPRGTQFSPTMKLTVTATSSAGNTVTKDFTYTTIPDVY
jgi:hypothetical protein